jgi:acetyltransferase-like isoleucine patch superfamily enzyme
MSANHDLGDLRLQRKAEPIRIGKYCWLGMGAVILPEVNLGDYTIVGAGSVVTKSFPNGYCVIAGSPAKMIRELNSQECMRFSTDSRYIGYIPIEKFEEFKKENLLV